MARKNTYSIKRELLSKSREAAMSAVQIFNNPNINFKSETFIVLIIIAWTYLMHAYYRGENIDYRYYDVVNGRKRFNKTKKGAIKHWELERCLNDRQCPLDKHTKINLCFLIGIRHEIEHQMTTKIDDLLSARFQACCLNYNEWIKKMFGNDMGIDQYLSFSLQFSTISLEQKELIEDCYSLPANIKGYIIDFDSKIDPNDYNNPKFSYRVLFTQKLVNHKGQADKVIEFIKPDSELASKINTQYWFPC